jgi:ketosteroid isomerase-like protein
MNSPLSATDDDFRRLGAIQRELVERDRSILDRLLAPEWMVTHADGRVSTREEVLREFDGGGNRLSEGQVEDIKVRVFDDCAVVIGRTYARGEYKGHLYDVTLRFTDVFVRRDEGWQAVASHACRIAT